MKPHIKAYRCTFYGKRYLWWRVKWGNCEYMASTIAEAWNMGIAHNYWFRQWWNKYCARAEPQ